MCVCVCVCVYVCVGAVCIHYALMTFGKTWIDFGNIRILIRLILTWKRMNPASQVQISDETVCASFRATALGEGRIYLFSSSYE